MRKLIAASILLLAGCGAGWRAVPPPGVGPLAARQQVQVWRADRVYQLHGVVITRDSISGIPYVRRLDCDSCRIVLPRATVDSLRFGDPEAGFLKGTALILSVWLLIAVTLVGGYGD